jgi:uncharacterized protein YbgA (DUF1722 family)
MGMTKRGKKAIKRYLNILKSTILKFADDWISSEQYEKQYYLNNAFIEANAV